MRFSDLRAGLARGRYCFAESQLLSAANFISGATIGAIVATLDGVKTWPEAGAEVAEWTLVALGLPRLEARAIAAADLPPLPETKR